VNRSLPLIVGAAGAAAGALLARERRARQNAERFAAAALESLLGAIDANDEQTGAHVRRVASYALVLADAIGLDNGTRRTIELTALFHDIGKIHEALFDIVHEERTLTDAERRAIRTHPERGAEVLAPIANFYPALAEAVLAHHERWDGSGYPRQLRGRRIPFAARVVMLADTFDAITHRRRYRDGRTVDESLRIILEARGTQFDPELVDLMLLPPVVDELKRAHRMARFHRRTGGRRHTQGASHAPDVQIRWRTRRQPPARVREKMADAR
jgi:putative nucleotidyltransferase with HDIG domain